MNKDVSPIESGLMPFVRMNKQADFIGKAALVERLKIPMTSTSVMLKLDTVVMQGKQFFKFSSPCMFKKLTTAFLSKEAENYKVPPASGITGNNLGMREREEKY